MRPNTLLQKLQAGTPCITGWLGIPSTYSAEIAGHAGFDGVLIDLQHGMIDFQTAVGMLQALSSTPATPIVRTPWNDAAQIMHLLDAGAYAVICPMISSAAQCAAFVRACRYPPKGERSFGPARGLLYGGADYFQHADATVMTWAMIETREALDNLDAILRIDELDAIYIGPNDLALALGAPPGSDFSNKTVADAIEHIRAQSQAAGKFTGIFCASGETAAQRIAQGFNLVTPSHDVAQLTAGMHSAIAAARGVAAAKSGNKTGY
jgi:4-hydroxy-2-oxoheptanedioate aldolase